MNLIKKIKQLNKLKISIQHISPIQIKQLNKPYHIMYMEPIHL